MKITEVQIDAAVEWWCKAFENPKFQTLRPGDNSEGSRPAAMAQMMAKLAHKAVDVDSRIKFRDALRRKLQGKEVTEVDLRVDYGPSRDLGECLDEAGCERGINSLPWKTDMRLEDGGVQVSCGYGEPYEELLH